jgi:BlaI family transcriptional regulator, penicillinase repressor
MKSLTKAEEEIMQVLWDLEKAFVKDIIEQLPEPKPAYNTVSTIVRILEKKGIVDHIAYGKTHEYFPLITKEEYSQKFLKNFVSGYFENSYKQLVSFFTRKENLSLKEIEDIMQILEQEKQKKKE